MALVKCYECGKEISEHAKICPHCGVTGLSARGVNAKQRALGIIMAVLGLALIILLYMDNGRRAESFEVFLSVIVFIAGLVISTARPRNKDNSVHSK